MFILYAVLIGLAGRLSCSGGHASGLAELKLRWPAVMLGGLLVQVALFSDQVAATIGDAGPLLYVASTMAVLGAILANRRLVGMPIVAYGAGSNLVAIMANGGYMPADPEALLALGKIAPTIYSNSSVVANPNLAALTDIFALPPWLPFANVFSVGDVIIGVGVAFVIAAAMRRGTRESAAGRRATA